MLVLNQRTLKLTPKVYTPSLESCVVTCDNKGCENSKYYAFIITALTQT